MPIALKLKQKIREDKFHIKFRQAYKASSNFYENVINSLEDYAIFTLDREGYVNSWNVGAKKLLGYDEIEIIGKNAAIFFTKDDVINHLNEYELETAISKGKSVDERWHVKKNGDYFWASGLLFPLTDENGELHGFTKIMRDRTEYKNFYEERDLLYERAQYAKTIADAERRRLELAQKTGKIGTFEWYLKENKIYWTPELESLYGLNPGSFEGDYESWIQKIYYEDVSIVENNLRNAIKGDAPYDVEFRIIWADNTIHWVLGKGTVTVDEEGIASRIIGVNIDITDRKQMELNLKFLSEASKFLSTSLNFKKTFQNVAKISIPHICDWCSVEILKEGELIQVALAHKDPEKVKWARELRKKQEMDLKGDSALARVLRTGKPLLYPDITEEMLIASAKSEEQLKLLRQLHLKSIMIAPILINQNAVGVIQFISTDIGRHYTKADLTMAEELASRASMSIVNSKLYNNAQKEIERRKKIEAALEESQFQFKALYNSNIIGVLYFKINGEIIDANDAFLGLLSYSRKDLMEGKLNWEDLTPQEFISADAIAIHELLYKGVATPWEKEYIKKDGTKVPVIVGAVLLNKQKKECLAFVIDIIERKKLEQRKDEFIGIASHELKTPLTSIKGYTQILERIIEQMGDDRLKLYLKKTNTYIDKLNSLIVDLLDVSRIQAGKLQLNFKEFDFDKYVKDILSNLQNISNKHKIKIEGKSNAIVRADETRIEQVLTNLIANAIKYSPKAKEVLVKIQKKGSYVELAVKDFGIGIPKSEHEKIFERFYRAESSAKKFSGLGIGLYISEEIIRRHHGQMRVESEENKGSTFYFTLPAIN